MAASEVAIAASHVATAAAQVPAVNGWTLVLTSAVVASLINGGVLWWLKRGDRRREDQANAKRRELAHRDAAYVLEAFAREANDYSAAIDDALPEYCRHDMTAFDRLDHVHLRFDLPPATVVSELSAARVDELRELREGVGQSAAWVAGQHHWTGKDDEYEFETQRAIHFGSVACRLADAMRAEVGVSPYSMTAQYLADFDAQFERLAERYAKRQGCLELIPELQPRMKDRFPGLLVVESEGL
ncbi:hypothetical protein I6G56_00225 (plasmid) [Burkholderia humptydooensis]|uniref:Uncharacterized protein n=2 Tax=Burkholderia humptydooensis TaxID=430531 RepID=A0A7U4P7X2_9BURK|nr:MULTISPECIES: hypothetical protein [Burkholderia]AJY38243.1 hypothetical protein BW21_6363 [Burkholderia sp. 2002721687]ALX44629.1 hypothetical protein AQ610_19000 [Burkholderia humptydooensis]QPS41990.1 hypothetical protein I6G56_00225 [Burkholderia humptydooensis]